jgi:hypothetical protein
MNDLLAFLPTIVGIGVWWTMTRDAWRHANSYMGEPMKALAVTIIVAPIAGIIAGIVTMFIVLAII